MPEKNEKQLESVSQSGGWKGRRIRRKGFVEKISLEPGVEERRSNKW